MVEMTLSIIQNAPKNREDKKNLDEFLSLYKIRLFINSYRDSKMYEYTILNKENNVEIWSCNPNDIMDFITKLVIKNQ
jgi:hypothetical protein